MEKKGSFHGSVHCGFDTAFDSIVKPLLDAIAKLPQNKPYFITGHFFGGRVGRALRALLRGMDEDSANGLYLRTTEGGGQGSLRRSATTTFRESISNRQRH